jgi:membrane protein required for colicin V production
MIAKGTLNKSLFYNPIQVSKYIYPSLEKWYAEFKPRNQPNARFWCLHLSVE